MAEADDDTYVIGLAEDADGGGNGILFMGPNEDEDEYCVVVEPGQRSFYGGILDCTLSGSGLSITFSSSASATLAVPPSMEVCLSISQPEREMLENGLKRILGPLFVM